MAKRKTIYDQAYKLMLKDLPYVSIYPLRGMLR